MHSRFIDFTKIVLGTTALLTATLSLQAATPWQEQHDQLVKRLRALSEKEAAFGPLYRPLYHAALPWYELWGGRVQHTVDDFMVNPEVYADELATSLEHGHNFFADNPGASFPLTFQGKLKNGKLVSENYWLSLPEGFGAGTRSFPLIINLHGSGWLDHPLSFVKGGQRPGKFLSVTPIDREGPWQIPYLNAYLDRLIDILPVDKDHVYVQGHSLGGMATWEWAENNPERFAAISPHSGIGEPYRAARLKNVPVWILHGEEDESVLLGNDDQMASAVQAIGGCVIYSVLKHTQHNMPTNLNEQPITDWYLHQTRSHQPVPLDPRDSLGLNAAGFSSWKLITVPAQSGWLSESMAVPDDATGDQDADRQPFQSLEKTLYNKVHARGEIADSPIRYRFDATENKVTLWLARPVELLPLTIKDETMITRPETQYVRFYFRGSPKRALEHIKAITAEVAAAGRKLGTVVWVTPLSLWHYSPDYIAEYWVELL